MIRWGRRDDWRAHHEGREEGVLSARVDFLVTGLRRVPCDAHETITNYMCRTEITNFALRAVCCREVHTVQPLVVRPMVQFRLTKF